MKDDLGDLRSDAPGLASATSQADTTAIRETPPRGEPQARRAWASASWSLIVLGVFLSGRAGTRQEGVAAAARGRSAATTPRDRRRGVDDGPRDDRGGGGEARRGVAERPREVGERVDEATAAEDTARRGHAAADEAAAAIARRRPEPMQETTEVVVQTLEELRDGFAALTRSGRDHRRSRSARRSTTTTRACTSSAATCAQAMLSYRGFFAFEDLEFVDPHLRFQAFLKLHNGVAGAREAYYDLRKGAPDEPRHGLRLEPPARRRGPYRRGWRRSSTAHPEFAPAWYELSRDYSVARLGHAVDRGQAGGEGGCSSASSS